jgi:CHASE2 domain-containing sensor protein
MVDPPGDPEDAGRPGAAPASRTPSQGEAAPKTVHFLHHVRLQLAATCFAGLAMVGLLQIPAVKYSSFGQPDREMIGQAFSLKANVLKPGADPILFMDIDDEAILDHLKPAPFAAPPDDHTPRDLLAHLLQYILRAPKGRAPTAVLLDVDIANRIDDPATVNRLHDALAAWTATPGAPTLVISRETFPAAYMGVQGGDWVLPQTPYDDVVDHSNGRIVWAASRVLSDSNGVVREFSPQGCVRTDHGETTLLADVAAVYRAAVGGRLPPGSPIAAALAKGCDPTASAKTRESPGELIDYQFSYPVSGSLPAWGDMPKTWPGYGACGASDPAAFIQVVPAGAVEQAGSDADVDLLCRRLVLIGGTNQIGNDVQKTPLGVMPGVMILANAVRGLEITHGGMRQAPIAAQLASVTVLSAFAWLMSRSSAVIFNRYIRLRSQTRDRHLLIQVLTLPVHPILAQWLLGAINFYVGIAILVTSIDLGYWSCLSAGAFAAVVAGFIQTFSMVQKSIESLENAEQKN